MLQQGHRLHGAGADVDLGIISAVGSGADDPESPPQDCPVVLLADEEDDGC